MRAPSQRRALAALFVALTLGFAGIATAAGLAERWVIAAAAAALALWMASLAAGAIRS